jgi:hypothetical protein
VLLRAFLVSIVLTFGVSGSPGVSAASGTAVAETVSTTLPDDDTTRPTINEFMPEDRALSDCLSSLPKPGCGSKARGGWRQTLVFLVIIGAITFIIGRVVMSSRKARGLPTLRQSIRDRRTPDATSARGDAGGDHSP